MTDDRDAFSRKIATFTFFDVKECPLKPRRKCHEYLLVNSRQQSLLGIIKWYGGWRAFVLEPEPNTVWSAGCLADVQSAMATINKRRMEKP